MLNTKEFCNTRAHVRRPICFLKTGSRHAETRHLMAHFGHPCAKS
ncbi:hypothetical protein BN1012_Phect1186 [Candidatus Phaeomarinobacter ectocarpi]|uniref:Uncharacterized protein n=1 Tax=Candidatus Phaeomarinibacter ectocarpi TaxID=1458461 RepID=X5MLD5_9HYPH|nr:hypothetical protein BN1012_Phect1186 [Candidatus Phaeomarinobacter ectocarpi]